MKELSKNAFFVSLPTIGRNTCPMAATSSFHYSYSPEPPLSGDACGIIPAHCHDHQNGQQTGCVFPSLLFCLWPWRPLGQNGAISRSMVASSGFQSSHGHPPLGNASCITSTPLHGHQNSLLRRHICLLPLIFCMTLLVAKDHVMVH